MQILPLLYFFNWFFNANIEKISCWWFFTILLLRDLNAILDVNFVIFFIFFNSRFLDDYVMIFRTVARFTVVDVMNITWSICDSLIALNVKKKYFFIIIIQKKFLTSPLMQWASFSAQNEDTTSRKRIKIFIFNLVILLSPAVKFILT